MPMVRFLGIHIAESGFCKDSRGAEGRTIPRAVHFIQEHFRFPAATQKAPAEAGAFSPEVNECNECNDEAIDGKASQRRSIQEFQEPKNGCIRHEESGHKSDGQNAKVTHFKILDRFQKVIDAGKEHQRDRHDEGKVRCRFSGDSQKQAAGDGATASGEARPEREALEEPDFQRLLPCDVVYICHRKMLMHFFCCDHEDTAQHQTDDDCHGAKERMFDEPMENKPQKAGRKHGDGQIQKRGALGTKPVMGIHDKGKFFSVHHENRKNRAELDKDIEEIGERPFEPQHMPDDDHMSRR